MDQKELTTHNNPSIALPEQTIILKLLDFFTKSSDPQSQMNDGVSQSNRSTTYQPK